MSDCNDAGSPKKARSEDRGGRENGNKSHRRRDSSSDSDHRHSHKRSHRHKHSHRSSDHRRHDSRRDRSRSRDRSHKRDSRSSSRRHSPSRHRSSRHRSKRSRSPVERPRSQSPKEFDRAMAAQEKLARRLERAKQMQKRKEEYNRNSNERLGNAVKKAADLVSESINSNYEGLSAKATAQVEALRAKAFAETGIEIPKYYNPLAINPMNYAQQAAKRKKLWAKKDTEEEKEKQSDGGAAKTALWSGVKFADMKSNEKFAKLMGIKSDSKDSGSTASQDIVKKQAEVFQNLDLQYQQARLATHTQRGVGLGFSSTYIDPNIPGSSK